MKVFSKNSPFSILCYFIGFIAVIGIGLSGNDRSSLLYKISVAVLFFTFFLRVTFYLVFYIYSLVKALISEKKWYCNIMVIVLMISILLFTSGIVILILATPIEGKYEINYVRIIKVKKDKVEINYTKFNNGKYKTIEIYRPFFLDGEKDDIIHVRYPVNKPSKMFYILDVEIGEQLLGLGLFLGSVIFILILMLISKDHSEENDYNY